MPRLPTAGPRPVPQPELSVATIRTGQEAAAIADLGNVIADIEDRRTKARRASQLSGALAQAHEQLGMKAIEYSRDQDFKTSPVRFKADATTIGQTLAGGIDDKIVKDAFLREFGKTAAMKQLAMVRHASRQEGDFNIAKLDSEEDMFAKSYANATTLGEQENAIDQFKIAVEATRAAGWIKEADAEKRLRSFARKADLATGMRDTNDNAETAYNRLTSDSKYLPNLDPIAREQLTRQAEVRMRQVEADRVRADKAADDGAREQFFQKFRGGKLSATDPLFSDPSIKTEIKEKYLGMLKTQSREALETPVKSNSRVMLDLFRRARLPYGDPDKLTSTEEVDKAYIGREISDRDHAKLEARIREDRDSSGDTLSKDVRKLSRQVEKRFMEAYQFVAHREELPDAVLRFTEDLETKIKEYRKANKDPRSLLTPGSPDYMGDPKVLSSYYPDAKQAVADRAASAVASGKNAKGWRLMTDAKGNKAYVSPDGKQFEAVK